jgi:hypothetical protein
VARFHNHIDHLYAYPQFEDDDFIIVPSVFDPEAFGDN